MSKITNLIGTTWRLDGYAGVTSNAIGDYSVDGLIAGDLYGTTVDGSFTTFQILGTSTIGAVNLVGEFYAIDPENDERVFMGENCTLYPTILVTITGGADISNPLFIDFINTYGTLVSGGEPPTAEGVKSKLQSLITASNRKTGNNDTNLTDAVRALVDGYGQGEEVAEYDGAVVIEDAAEEEPEKTYSLTITNTGDHIYNEYIYYSVDSEECGDLQIEANSTLKIDGIKNYVYCQAGTEFRETSTVLNNCTIEWLDSASCKIYPTGDNATATLESYD